MAKYIKDIVEQCEAVEISKFYQLGTDNINELAQAYKDPYARCMAFFKIGYLQGQKAEKAGNPGVV